MRIAIIINTSWNIYNFRKGLVKHFLNNNHEVIAIAPKDNYSEKLVQLGCEYVEVPMSGSGMNPIQDFGLITNLRKALSKSKPDIVLSYTIKPNIYGSLVCRLLGIPIICNVSGLGTVFLWKGSVKRLATSLYNFSFRFSSWVFFQNEEDRSDFLEQVRIPLSKTSILPGSGIDTEYFKPTASSSPQPVFLMIGRLLIDKGIYDYIEAIKILKKQSINATFKLVGTLNEEHSRSIKSEELESWIKGGLIQYHDHQDDIRPLIADSSVVVLPSYREGTPRTLLEAGAMGKVLIATDVPGCRQVVLDGENGFLCKLKSPKDLAAKMKLFLSLSKQEQSTLMENSRNSIVDRYDEKLVIDQYVSKIEDLVGSV